MLCPAARPPAGTMCSIRNRKLSAGMYRRPHRPAKDNGRFHSYSRYSVSAHWPVVSAPPSYAAENRPACARLVVISYNQSSALAIFILFRVFSVLPESCSCPLSGGVSRCWYALHSFGPSCPEVVSWRYFPCRWYFFRTVIHLFMFTDELI